MNCLNAESFLRLSIVFSSQRSFTFNRKMSAMSNATVSVNHKNRYDSVVQAPAPWEEQKDYSALNENIGKNKENMNGKRCNTKPICCNCCMCGYLCLSVLVLMAAIVIAIIYGIEPALQNVVPQLHNVYIQVWDYGIGEDKWAFGSKSFSKIFLNATGGFVVEAYNPNFFGMYIHDWKLDTIALNLYQNPEQWGETFCCAEHPNWNHSNPYIRGQEAFAFDKRQWLGSQTDINMTFVLFINHLSEELFYMAWEASWLNDWQLNLSLSGGGWGKTDTFSMDVKVLVNCNVSVNAS